MPQIPCLIPWTILNTRAFLWSRSARRPGLRASWLLLLACLTLGAGCKGRGEDAPTLSTTASAWQAPGAGAGQASSAASAGQTSSTGADAASPPPPAPVEAARDEIVVLVEAPSMSARDAEVRIAIPLEDSLSGLRGVAQLATRVEADRVELRIWPARSADVRALLMAVAEATRQARADLPDDVGAPQVRVARQGGALLLLEVSGAARVALAAPLRERIAPALARLAGVRDVVDCLPRRQVEVTVDAARLRAFDLTTGALTAQLRGALEPDLIRMTPPPADDLSSLARLAVGVTSGGADVVGLADVAVVAETYAPGGCVWLPGPDDREEAATLMLVALERAEDAEGVERALTALNDARGDEGVAIKRLGLLGDAQAQALGVVLPEDAQGAPLEALAKALGGEAREAGALAVTPETLARLDALRPASGASLLVVPGDAARAAALERRLRSAPGVQVVPWRAPPLALAVTGEDVGALARVAASLVAALRETPGVVAAHADGLRSALLLDVTLDRGRLAALGLSVDQAAAQLRLALRGEEVVGELADVRGPLTPVVLRVGDGGRQGGAPDAARLERVALTARDGQRVPLSSVTAVTRGEVATLLTRRGGARVVYVVAHLGAERDAEALREALEAAAAAVDPGAARVEVIAR